MKIWGNVRSDARLGVSASSFAEKGLTLAVLPEEVGEVGEDANVVLRDTGTLSIQLGEQ